MDRKLISGSALVVAAICLLPLIGVVAAASLGTLDTLARLAETVLWDYTWTTCILYDPAGHFRCYLSLSLSAL